jgi:hypothetical protein
MVVMVLREAAPTAQRAPLPAPRNEESPLANTATRLIALDGGAVIGNGTVQLGVAEYGDLDVWVGYGLASDGYLGLRYIPTGGEATHVPNCEGCSLREGWGIRALRPGTSEVIVRRNTTNTSYGGDTGDLTVQSFAHGASTASSTVLAVRGGTSVLSVTHQYEPSRDTPYLYEAKVTVENIWNDVVRVQYWRQIDWNIDPTRWAEYVTIREGTSPFLVATSNAADADPPYLPPGSSSAGVDIGPDDLGATFVFDFRNLSPGESVTFRTYLGAAGTEAEARAALASVGAEAYSYGQPSSPGGPGQGVPNTFIYAFGGIGGGSVSGAPTLIELAPNRGGDCGPATVLGLGSGFKPGAQFRLKRDGQPDIVATDTTVAPNGVSILGRFDLTAALQGSWDAEVVNPDDGDPDTPEVASLAGGFDVLPCELPCIDVLIVGPAHIAANGRGALFHLAIVNLGTIDATDVTVSLRGIPSDFQIQVRTLDLASELVASGFDVLVPVLPPDTRRFFSFVLGAPPTELPRSIDMRAVADPTCAGAGQRRVEVVGSLDPNVKSGPAGVGPEAFDTGTAPMAYVISFENSPGASAPAQNVVIVDQLDVTKYDLATFSLGPIRFGSLSLDPLPGTSAFGPTVVPFDVVDDVNTNGDLLDDDILVEVDARLIDDPGDAEYGRVEWRLRSIDPSTGALPTDPARGFLPPNVSPPGGEGSVVFAVNARGTLVTGEQVWNAASITFDANQPIVTPEWLNTIDRSAPESQVQPLPASQDSPSFLVEWEGTDRGSGIARFDVFVTDNDGPAAVFQSETTVTSAMFTGEVGHTYGFYSVAHDNVGLVEDPPPGPDVTTRVRDTNGPTFEGVPAHQTLEVTSAAGAVATWTDPTATDTVDGMVPVTCAPASGSTFPIGTSTVTCSATDTDGNTATATFTIIVLGATGAPVALDRTVRTREDRRTFGALSATDPTHDRLDFRIVSNGSKGTAWLLHGKSRWFVYRPRDDENGTDSFTFVASDGTSDSNVATVTVIITPVNDAPVASPLWVSTEKGTPVSGVLVAADVDGDALKYRIVEKPEHGTVTLDGKSGAFVYTPKRHFTGRDSFEFRAYDGSTRSDEAKVRIRVTR